LSKNLSPPLALTLLAAVAGLSAAPVTASDDYYDESDLLADIPTVSAGARMDQARHHSPSSVTVIDSETIAALAPNNLVEVFRLVPGFMSFYINASLHGLSGHDLTDDDPRRLEVRINGRSVYVPAYPTVSWASLGISPDDIQRIEVARGSNVPAYGSNAVMGAVNITTKSPLEESGTHIRTTVGEQDTRNINIRHNFELTDGYGQVRISHSENNGFDNLPDDSSVNHLVFNTIMTPSLLDTFNLEVGLSDGSFGIGDGDYLKEFAYDENTSYWLTAEWSRVEQQQQWKSHFSFYSSDSEHSVVQSLAFVEEWSAEQLDFYLQGNPDVSFDYGWGKRESDLWEMELEYQYRFTKQVRALVGTGYKYQKVKAPSQLNQGGTIDNGILYGFTNIEWQLSPKWLTNVGFMVENQEHDETNVSSRASLHYQLLPQHNFRFSASRAYRSPSIFESNREVVDRAYDDIYLDYDLLTDDNLGAEEIETLELAYYGSFFDGKVDIDWRAYHEDMEGGIDHVKWTVDHQGWIASDDYDEGDPTDPDNRAHFFSNSKDWRITGYDIQVKWRPLVGTELSLQHSNLRVNSTRIRHWFQAPNGVPRGKDRVPEHTGSLLIRQQLGWGLSTSLFSYHQSEVRWRGGEAVESFYRHDFALSKVMDLAKHQLRLDLKIDNITDEKYLEYGTGNYLNRTSYLSVSVHW